MSEERWLSGAKPIEPIPRAHRVIPESFVFAANPANQEAVQCPQRTV